jgi:uncharacterized protein YndB with AHSA1/START domain
VWAAWTEPAILSLWLGTAIECDIRVGGRLVVDHGEGTFSRSEIAEADAPHRLVMTWDFPDEAPSRLFVSVAPADEGSFLTLTHEHLGALDRSYESGWITHLTFLEAAAFGDPIPISQFWKLHATVEALSAASHPARE